MSKLGHRIPSTVALNPSNPILAGGWTITFLPKDLATAGDFEMYHGFVRGPGGSFYVYIDDHGYGVGQNGSRNEYAPSGENMFVRKGQTIYFHWDTAAGNAPTAVIYLQTVPELR